MNSFSITYSITSTRISCTLLSLAKKRAISNGQAQVAIGEPGTVAAISNEGSNGSFPIWIIIVAVIGGLILLVALVILVFFVYKKTIGRKAAWEKY